MPFLPRHRSPTPHPNRACLALGFVRALAVGLLLLSFACAQGSEPPVRIGLESNSPPLSFLNNEGKIDGFSIELLREIERVSDLRFEVTHSNWSFIKQEFDARRIDALANVMILPSRRETMDFSIPHATVHAVAFTRPGEPRISHTRQFAGKTLAVVQGAISHLTAESHQGWGARIQLYASRRESLMAVKEGACDFAIHVRTSAQDVEGDFGLESEFVRDILHNYRIAVHRGDARTLERINEGLAQAIRNGSLDRLYAKWIGPIEPHPIRLADLRPYALPIGLSLVGLVAVLVWQQRTIEERKRMAESLKESEMRFRAIGEHSLAGVYITQNGVLTYANPALARIFGYARDELIGQPTLNFIHPDDRERAAESLRKRMSGESTSDYLTFRGIRKNGEVIEAEVLGSRAVLDGQPAAIGNLLDITEKKRSETALRESEARFRLLIRNLHAGVVLYDAKGQVTFCNETALELLGLTEPQLLSPTSCEQGLDIIHEDGSPMPQDTLPVSRVLATRQPARDVILGIFNPVRKARTWLSASAELLASEPLQVLCVFHDITHLRSTEARLRLQSAALNAAVNMVAIADLHGRIEWVNPAFTRCTGYSFDEVVGRDSQFLRPDRQLVSATEDLASSLRAGRSWSGKWISQRKNGSKYTEEATVTPVRDLNGSVTHFVAVTQDITDREALERRIIEAQRLDSIGLLASGIAHDLNNIITPISLSMELLRAEYPGENETADMVEQCARRGAEIVRQVLAFSRGMDGTRTPHRLGRLIEEIARLMAETLPKSIELTFDLAPCDDTVRVDPTQIHQVLLNLAINARDAMPKGGSLRFSLTHQSFEDQDAALEPGVKGGRYVAIAVADTGTGIPPENLSRIFDPFYTTKPRGQGTGLGLSAVHGIVRSHGGFIRVESTVNVGTTFRIYLPLDSQPEVATEETAARPAMRGQGRCILIADDEAIIRTITEKVLRSRGFTTVLAEDGLQAVARFRERASTIDLVLLDRMMPGMSGENAAEIMHQLAPNVPIILTTGLITDDDLIEQQALFRRAGIVTVLRKPFTEDQLLRLVGAQLKS